MSPIIVHCRTNSWQPTALQRICTRASQLNYLRKTLKLFLLERSQALLFFHLFDSLWMWNEHVTKTLVLVISSCLNNQLKFTISVLSRFQTAAACEVQIVSTLWNSLFDYFSIEHDSDFHWWTWLWAQRPLLHFCFLSFISHFRTNASCSSFFLPSRDWVMVENLQKVFQFCVELFQQMHIAHAIVSAPLRVIFSDRALSSLACCPSTCMLLLI